MNKYLGLFLPFFALTGAFATEYMVDTPNIDVFDDYNITINHGVVISANSSGIINTKDYGVTHLNNYGTINGTIDTNGRNIIIVNSGTISGGISANGGMVQQNVSSNVEMSPINVVGGSYKVTIENVQNADFNVIKSINATSFVMKDSVIIVNNLSDLQNWTQDVRLNGQVCLIVNNVEPEELEITIDNISNGIENLSLQINNVNSAYAVKSENKGGTLVITTERVTDSNLIYKGGNTKNHGEVLEQIRNKHPGDKLINALDNAKASDIDNIKNNSYRFNHSILLRPIKMINSFTLSENIIPDDGVGLNTFYVFSNSVKDFGGEFYIGGHFDNLYLNFGLNIHDFVYKDDLNDFSGLSYGLNIKAKQKINNFWIDGIVGLALTKYNADYVTDENALETNPFGLSEYGKISVGYDFKLTTDFIISPFVGSIYQRNKVADINENDLNFIGGTDVKYNFVVDGIKYEYAFSGSVANNSDVYASFKIGFLSLTDGAGASFNAGVLKNEYDYYYKLSVNAKILF